MKSKLKSVIMVLVCISTMFGCLTGGRGVLGNEMVQAAATTSEVIKLPLNIPANMRTKQVVKKDAGSKSSLKLNKVAVTLKKKKSIKILSEKTVSGKRWYQISFQYKGAKRTGYVPASETALTLKNRVEAYISPKKGVTVKKGAGTKKANLSYKKKAVTLANATKVSIRKEYQTAGKRWYRISFTYKKKKMKGYILANKVKFVVKTKKKENPPVSGDFEEMLTAQGFPEDYKVKLREIHLKYPEWKFQAFHTGLDWNTAIDGEAVVKAGGSAKNVIPNSKSVAWKMYESSVYNWATDTHTVFDGTYWVAASRMAVEYYMDPRNFLDDRGIFQFEALEYQPGYQTVEGVNKILQNTPFHGVSYTYVDDGGNTVTKSYADTFMEAAATSGVSPYHLASRVKQEVVTGAKTVSNSVTGTVKGYEGIYNFFNIGASDSKTGQAVVNGLKYASSGTTNLRPWNNQYKSIVGGATYIGEKYINRTDSKLAGTSPQTVGKVNTGQQNTLYLQKFNVTPYAPYTHQYMTNVEAPNAEATKVSTAYKGTLDSSPLVFTIPVYLNMPHTAAPIPNGGLNPNNYLRNLEVNGTVVANDANAVAIGDSNMTYPIPAVSGSSVTLKARAANTGAHVKVINKGVEVEVTQKDPYTIPLNLNIGENNVTITVTAQNGEVRIYRFVINRTS